SKSEHHHKLIGGDLDNDGAVGSRRSSHHHPA
ncbi:hypothetical protein A2U01_0072112, partial [Trifolium medium]|nr:hypothetical protein [Trifolium medium]